MIIQVWTNGLFKAAEHRVLSSTGQRGRYSAPYFYNPDYDVVVEPLDCAVLLTTSQSPSTNSQSLSASSSINIINSTTVYEAEMTAHQEGTTTHRISTVTADVEVGVDPLLSDKMKKKEMMMMKKKYSAIRWGDYRTKRFLGDFRDEGDEIQIEHFQKG